MKKQMALIHLAFILAIIEELALVTLCFYNIGNKCIEIIVATFLGFIFTY